MLRTHSPQLCLAQRRKKAPSRMKLRGRHLPCQHLAWDPEIICRQCPGSGGLLGGAAICITEASQAQRQTSGKEATVCAICIWKCSLINDAKGRATWRRRERGRQRETHLPSASSLTKCPQQPAGGLHEARVIIWGSHTAVRDPWAIV